MATLFAMDPGIRDHAIECKDMPSAMRNVLEPAVAYMVKDARPERHKQVLRPDAYNKLVPLVQELTELPLKAEPNNCCVQTWWSTGFLDLQGNVKAAGPFTTAHDTVTILFGLWARARLYVIDLNTEPHIEKCQSVGHGDLISLEGGIKYWFESTAFGVAIQRYCLLEFSVDPEAQAGDDAGGTRGTPADSHFAIDDADAASDVGGSASSGSRDDPPAPVDEALQSSKLLLGSRVNTSSLYPNFPIATVMDISKGYCTLVYADNTKDPPRSCNWVAANLTVYPAEGKYAYIRFDGTRWLVRDEARSVFLMSRNALGDDLDDWIIECAQSNPSFWLPVEPKCFIKLQAKTKNTPLVHDWIGVLPRGYHRPLPEAYVVLCFSEDLMDECKKSVFAVDCTEVGAAASARRKGAPASVPAVVGPPSRFLSDGEDGEEGKDYCIAYGAAAAVDLAGDAATADILGGLAADSVTQPAGTNRMLWVKNESAQRLRRFGWETRKVKNAQQLSTTDVLGTPPRGVVTVYQVADDSKPPFIEHAFAKVTSPGGRKWLADQNRGYVPLSQEGLDQCCVGDNTAFGGVVSAFTLTRKQDSKTVPPVDEPAAKKPRVLF